MPVRRGYNPVKQQRSWNAPGKWRTSRLCTTRSMRAPFVSIEDVQREEHGVPSVGMGNSSGFRRHSPTTQSQSSAETRAPKKFTLGQAAQIVLGFDTTSLVGLSQKNAAEGQSQ